jgi:hypothetical protein
LLALIPEPPEFPLPVAAKEGKMEKDAYAENIISKAQPKCNPKI